MKGWQSVRLGDVAVFVRGITFKPDDVVPVGTPGSVACMRTKNVQSELDQSDVWAVHESLVRRPDQFLSTGDILVSSANSWNLVGKCSWIPELPWRASFGGFVSVLRPERSCIDPRFLYHWFSAERTQAVVRSFGQKTTNISNLNTGRTLDLRLNLPPLREQRRIAEVLDRAETLRAKRREALAQLDNLTRCVFHDLVGEPTTNPKGWEVLPLREIATTSSGGTPDRSVADYFGGDIPWVKSGELHDGVVSSTEECLTHRGVSESSAKVVPAGTILVAMYGATAGLVARLGTPAATNQAICCIQPNDSLDPTYLVHLLMQLTPSLLARRVGGAQPNLSQSLIRDLRVPVPPLAVQHQFAHRIAVVERLKGAQRTSLTEIDALFASLQHRAFRGEL